MKTASLITVHVGANFGSVLQTIASCEILGNYDCRTTVVNYIPDRITNKRILLGFIKGCTSARGIARGIVHLINHFINKYIYLKYLSSHCNLSTPIYSKDNFRLKCPNADIYVTGSDQVWNCQHNEGVDTHYLWGSIEGRKIAYASSIGASELTEQEEKSFKHYLSEYKAISVRELKAVELLKKIGIKSSLVLDPTFMLNKEEWKKYASKRIIEEPYILSYLPYNIVDKELIYRTVYKIAKEKNLKVVTFSWNWNIDQFADKTVRFSSPGDFLSLMLYADCVVTNSFHGTAFSVNLNKEFWVYMPSKFPSRIESILTLCGLKDRVLTSEITATQIKQEIDYRRINDILESEREKAKNFLNESLS